MNDEMKEIVFLGLTSLIVLMAIYALNMFGMAQAGVWGAALALCGVALGYFAFAEAQKSASVLEAAAVLVITVVLAIFGGSVPVLGGFSLGGLGFVFLVFFLIPLISKTVRGKIVSKEENKG